jgi:hypothetical protein
MTHNRSSERLNQAVFQTARFDCNAGCGDAFQYLRFFTKGTLWGSHYRLGLSALKFFGTLRKLKTRIDLVILAFFCHAKLLLKRKSIVKLQ